MKAAMGAVLAVVLQAPAAWIEGQGWVLTQAGVTYVTGMRVEGATIRATVDRAAIFRDDFDDDYARAARALKEAS